LLLELEDPLGQGDGEIHRVAQQAVVAARGEPTAPEQRVLHLPAKRRRRGEARITQRRGRALVRTHLRDELEHLLPHLPLPRLWACAGLLGPIEMANEREVSLVLGLGGRHGAQRSSASWRAASVPREPRSGAIGPQRQRVRRPQTLLEIERREHRRRLAVAVREEGPEHPVVLDEPDDARELPLLVTYLPIHGLWAEHH